MLYPKRASFPIVVFFIVCAFLLIGCNSNQQSTKPLTVEEVRAIAKESYIYAFPMLEFYRVEYLNGVLLQQFNKMLHMRDLKTCDDKTVVRPNNDTLYTIVHLDLRAEPHILEVPAVTDRYYAFQLIDVYTHVPYFIGTRATGTQSGKYLIAGPRWRGNVAPGLTGILRVESDFIMLLGRTAVNGPYDLEAAHALQDQYKLYPLSDYTHDTPPVVPDLSFPIVDAAYPWNFNQGIWFLPGTPPLNPSIPGTPPYKEMSADFITYLNFQLGRLQIAPSEYPLFRRFAQIGIGPDRSFDSSSLDASTLNAINLGIGDAKAQINGEIANIRQANGWTLLFDVWGNRARMEGRYTLRALAALIGLFGNPAEEAVYPSAFVDHAGQPLDGTVNEYVITFPAGQWPPVMPLGFWSLTMYDADGFLVYNPINRYSIGSLGKGYTTNPDGSLSIYLQSRTPAADKINNWLPAPQGSFSVTLRIYLPQDVILHGQWTPPDIVKVN
ncbi:MAG: DUF1254 domain-containing protein [Syntrophaceae bacterium]|jgi:hypothetical protein|nr:DUF1254 domain-containing protein [Syntrophaceae bacterium]